MYLPKPTEGGTYTPPPAGSHPAVCVRVIDLGTQEKTFKGEVKHARQIMLAWELADPDIRRDDGQPFLISQRFTFSMHEKAILRKTLEAWRGVPFVDADFGEGGFDMRNLLGKGCLLGVIHQVRGDKTYANINSIMKLPKGMPAPQAESEMIYLALTPDRFVRTDVQKLSDKLQETVKASPEYRSLVGVPSEEYPSHMQDEPPPLAEDEIPF